jgi:geranylgeranyl diphosphate synthase type II
MQDTSFDTQLREKAQFVNDMLSRLLVSQTDISGGLKEAIKYTLEARGKRIRSALVLWCCEVVSGSVNHDAEVAAAAIEMVHTYSLVHDDLPAMDNDDLRRGQPTCHKAFDEATAILTGDALLTLAFEVLAEQISEPAIAVKLIRQLAHDAGPAGMIAGQMADLRAEDRPAAPTRVGRRGGRRQKTDDRGRGTEELIQFIHTNKTAKMFRCAAAMGAICGRANDAQLDALCEYGLKIGLGFQIADDILDASATSEHLGKTAGKDVKAGKVTYLKLLGMEKSKQMEKKLADEAVAALQPFGKEANILRQLAAALLKRTR